MKDELDGVLHARVSRTLITDFAEVARRHNRTVSQEIRQVMRQHIDANAEPTVEAA